IKNGIYDDDEANSSANVQQSAYYSDDGDNERDDDDDDDDDPFKSTASMEMLSMETDAKALVERLKSKPKYRRKPWWKLLRNCIVAAGLLYFGLLLAKLSPLSTNWLAKQMYAEPETSSNGLAVIFGGIMVAMGCILGLNFLLGLCMPGRKFLRSLSLFVRARVVTIILIIIAIMYIPMTTTLFRAYDCSRMTCSAGQEFVVYPVSLDFTTLAAGFTRNASQSSACVSCDFNSSTCAIASQLCPGDSGLRLNTDPSLSCTDELYPYYVPGATLVFFTVTLGIPIMYYRLVKLVTRYVREIPVSSTLAISNADSDSRIANEAGGFGMAEAVGSQAYLAVPPKAMDRKDLSKKEDEWRVQVGLSMNAARGLYKAFLWKWRFYSIITLARSLAALIVFVFVVYYPAVLTIAIFCIHFVFFVLSVAVRPYLNLAEDILSAVCLLLNAVNALISILVIRGIDIPPSLIYVLAPFNIALPLLAVGYAVLVVIREKKGEKALEAAKKGKKTVVRIGAPRDDEERRAKRELLQLVARIDEQLNTQILKEISTFFLLVGLASFISFCITVVGILKASGTSTVVGATALPHTNESAAAEFEFGGYASWAEFTTNCCCEQWPLQKNSTAGDGKVYEFWKW
ncbi:hypothetical protein HK104_004037, partial [Borealophlyctis nickersoniae]